jgi:hypothetical protein
MKLLLLTLLFSPNILFLYQFKELGQAHGFGKNNAGNEMI